MLEDAIHAPDLPATHWIGKASSEDEVEFLRVVDEHIVSNHIKTSTELFVTF